MICISIIVCSRHDNLSEIFINNLNDTIGVDYELIIVNNSKNELSIFQAYNLGLKKSKAKFVCFLHDDVVFHTKNWALIIVNFFQSNSDAGLLGIAGSKIKTKMPATWSDCDKKYWALNILQHNIHKKVTHNSIGFENDTFVEVVVLDGVFMVARKLEFVEFDEELDGFHNYDLDLSLCYLLNGFKIFVTNQILLEHFSNGTINDSWFNSSHSFYVKHKAQLPVFLNEIQVSAFKESELKNGFRFIKHFVLKNNFKIAFIYWLDLIINVPFSFKHFRIFFFVMFHRFIRIYYCKVKSFGTF